MSNFLFLSEDEVSYIVLFIGKASFFFPFQMTYALHNEEKKIYTMVIDTHFDKEEKKKNWTRVLSYI